MSSHIVIIMNFLATFIFLIPLYFIVKIRIKTRSSDLTRALFYFFLGLIPIAIIRFVELLMVLGFDLGLNKSQVLYVVLDNSAIILGSAMFAWFLIFFHNRYVKPIYGK